MSAQQLVLSLFPVAAFHVFSAGRSRAVGSQHDVVIAVYAAEAAVSVKIPPQIAMSRAVAVSLTSLIAD